MYIIGHRGAAGEKPENTLASIRACRASGAPIVEINVRLTSDGVPILAHDETLERTHGISEKLKKLSYQSLQKRTAGSQNPICSLKEALLEVASHMIVLLELKDKKSGIKVLELLASKDIKPFANNVIISSFSVRELIRVRNLNKKVKLSLLMHHNPFLFLAWEKKLGLTAVGFHRLHVPQLAIDAARKLDIFTYVYTVNRQSALKTLAKKRVDAVATDYPNKFITNME